MKNSTLEDLTQAVKGLLYISETESPLTPFAVKSGEVDADRVRALAGADKDTTVEESSLDDFFRVVPTSRGLRASGRCWRG